MKSNIINPHNKIIKNSKRLNYAKHKTIQKTQRLSQLV